MWQPADMCKTPIKRRKETTWQEDGRNHSGTGKGRKLAHAVQQLIDGKGSNIEHLADHGKSITFAQKQNLNDMSKYSSRCFRRPVRGFFLGKKKEIKDGLRCRLIWSMDYIYTKLNKQLYIDILMSLYSSFYPAEYAEDVTGSDTSKIWLDIDNRVPAINPMIGTRKPTQMVLKTGQKRSKISVFISVGTRFGTRKPPFLAHLCQMPIITNW